MTNYIKIYKDKKAYTPHETRSIEYYLKLLTAAKTMCKDTYKAWKKEWKNQKSWRKQTPKADRQRAWKFMIDPYKPNCTFKYKPEPLIKDERKAESYTWGL